MSQTRGAYTIPGALGDKSWASPPFEIKALRGAMLDQWGPWSKRPRSAASDSLGSEARGDSRIVGPSFFKKTLGER